LGGATGSGAALAAFCLSFDWKTFLKRGIVNMAGRPCGGPGCCEYRQIRGDAVAGEDAQRGGGSAMQGLKVFNTCVYSRVVSNCFRTSHGNNPGFQWANERNAAAGGIGERQGSYPQTGLLWEEAK
jgi:hypothetical protein